MKKSLENLLAKQGITLLNTLSKEERRARTETIKARYREAGYDDLPHELVTFLTIFDDKEIKRNDRYMAFISSQNLPTRQEMLYYESDAGVTELIPFGDVNADEVLCIDRVVYGVCLTFPLGRLAKPITISMGATSIPPLKISSKAK